MKHFYIIANRIKDKDLTVAGEIEQYLKAHGCRCTVERRNRKKRAAATAIRIRTGFPVTSNV